MSVYSPSEVATQLQIKTATLRKYSLLLEKHGYEIERNSKSHRYYRDKDIMTLRSVITGMKSGATLDKTVQNVVKMKDDSNNRNDIYNVTAPYTSDIEELKEMIQQQHKMLHKQGEMIQGLSDKLHQQQQHIDESIKERDNLLLEAAEPIKDKRGLLARIFNRQI